MDIGDNIEQSFGSGITSRIETKPIRVLITTDDYEIDGFMHIKPGGYQSRVSDILNIKGLHYLPLTNATYRSLHHPEELVRKVATLIIRIDTIKMVAPQNGAEVIGKDAESDLAQGEVAESDVVGDSTFAGDIEGFPMTGTES